MSESMVSFTSTYQKASVRRRLQEIRKEYSKLESEAAGIRSRITVIAGTRLQLAGLSSPFDKLPTELLSEILVIATHSHEDGTLRYEFPAQAQLVSQRWRSVLRQTPRVWTYFNNSTRSGHSAFGARVRRSGISPLDIVLDISTFARFDAIKDLIAKAHRWRSLSLSLSLYAYNLIDMLKKLAPGLNNVKTLSIFLTSPPFPSPVSCLIPSLLRVQKLSIKNLPLCWSPHMFASSEILELTIHHPYGFSVTAPQDFIAALRSLPRLTLIDISGLNFSFNHSSFEISPKFELPDLRTLAIGKMRYELINSLLAGISALNLQHLTLRDMGSVQDEILVEQWDFPLLENLELLDMEDTKQTLRYILPFAQSVKFIKMSLRDNGFLSRQTPTLDDTYPHFSSLISLSTRRVPPHVLRDILAPLFPTLPSLTVHITDLTLLFDDAPWLYHALERDIEILRELIHVEEDLSYEEDEVVPVVRRFRTWKERVEWAEKFAYPELC